MSKVEVCACSDTPNSRSCTDIITHARDLRNFFKKKACNLIHIWWSQYSNATFGNCILLEHFSPTNKQSTGPQRPDFTSFILTLSWQSAILTATTSWRTRWATESSYTWLLATVDSTNTSTSSTDTALRSVSAAKIEHFFSIIGRHFSLRLTSGRSSSTFPTYFLPCLSSLSSQMK